MARLEEIGIVGEFCSRRDALSQGLALQKFDLRAQYVQASLRGLDLPPLDDLDRPRIDLNADSRRIHRRYHERPGRIDRNSRDGDDQDQPLALDENPQDLGEEAAEIVARWLIRILDRPVGAA